MKPFARFTPVALHYRCFLIIALCAATLAGCGKSQPACVDESTIALVKQVVLQALEKDVSDASKDPALLNRLKQRIQVALTTIRTSNKDEKIGKVGCDASLEITLSDVGQITGDPAFKALQERQRIPASIDTSGAAWKSDIHYTAQHTDDKRELLVEVTDHAPMVRLLSTLAQAGAFDPRLAAGAIAPDLLAAGNAQQAALRLMNQVYGKQDAKHGCWIGKFEDVPYCMKIAQADIKAVDGGKRLYAIASGEAVDEKGEPMAAHAMQGLVGAFIVGEVDGKATFIAQSTKIQVGTMGAAPSKWRMLQLGANNNWGWQSEFGDCHQGYCGTRMIILANHGGTIVEVADVPIGYDDTGACGDEECTAKASTLQATVAVAEAPKDAAFLPLLVTVTGTGDGNPLAPKTWQLAFDIAKHTYIEPKDWPFADREF